MMRIVWFLLIRSSVGSLDPMTKLQRASGLTRGEFIVPRLIQSIARFFPPDRPSVATEQVSEIGETVQKLWEAIHEKPYTLDEMRHHVPKNVNGVIWQNTMSNHNFIVRTNKTSPCPHAKKLHAFGSWARVRWDAEPGTSYDGLWNRTNLTGLVRASRNGMLLKSTSEMGNPENRDQWKNRSSLLIEENSVFATKFSMALRLCKSNVLAFCQDIVFLPRETAAWQGENLFAQPQHTNVTFNPWISQAFQQVSTEPGIVNLSHIGEDSSPTELRLEPSKTFVEIWENGKDWRQTIAKLPKGTVLYTAYDENGVRIGNLTQTSESWVASEVGDTRVTFHHHLKEDASIDLQPILAPHSIPLGWLGTPSLIFILNSIVFKDNLDIDPFFGSKESALGFVGNNKLVQQLAEPFVLAAFKTTPSLGSLLNYFVNSTATLEEFAVQNTKTADVTQSLDLGMLGPYNAESGRVGGRFEQWDWKFVQSPRWNLRVIGSLQTFTGTILFNQNTGLTSTRFQIPDCWPLVMNVLRKHARWFATTFRREHAFWRRTDIESLQTASLFAAQNDHREFRFSFDLESDAWIDIHGNNRSCSSL